MPHSEPRVSSELQILLYLNPRMDLSPHDKKNLHNLRRGYEGERAFFHLVEKELANKFVRLYGLLLESNQTEFQIDNLLISQNTIYMNEIKYYEGDYFVRNDKWYAVASEKEIRNPMLQLQRSEFLLRKLLDQIGAKFQIESRLIFVHPTFTLYQAPYDQSVIFPTQLNRYMHQLNNIPSRLTRRHRELSRQLTQRHITTSRHERLPDYHFDQLEKGIVCSTCQGFMSVLRMATLRCTTCGHEEPTETGVMRTVVEFHTLFPERRVSTPSIYEFCKIINSKYRIRKILMENMLLVKNGKYSYFIFK